MDAEGDLSAGSAARELALVGFLGGGLTPATAFALHLAFGLAGASMHLGAYLLAPALVSAVVGALAGPVAMALERRRLPGTYALGVPIGFVGGGLAAWAAVVASVSPRIASELLPEVVWLGASTGGLFLGLVWVPWIALRRQNRTPVPFLLLSVAAAPFFAAIVAFGATASAVILAP